MYDDLPEEHFTPRPCFVCGVPHLGGGGHTNLNQRDKLEMNVSHLTLRVALISLLIGLILGFSLGQVL
jgi:hypothetical protein